MYNGEAMAKGADLSSSQNVKEALVKKKTTAASGTTALPSRRSKGACSDVSVSKETTHREGVALPLSLIKALRRKASSVGIGSTSSNGGGSGNNSDNSGQFSLGNNSFGFNFDSEEGLLNNSPQNSEAELKTGESDSDGNIPLDVKLCGTEKPVASRERSLSTSGLGSNRGGSSSGSGPCIGTGEKPATSSLTLSTHSSSINSGSTSHEAAAAAAVSNLQSIASAYSAKIGNKKEGPPTKRSSGMKRKTADDDDAGNETGGYNSDDEGGPRPSAALPVPATSHLPDRAPSSSFSAHRSGKKSKHRDESKREERNAREKERSYRITEQINELRNLLSNGGVIVPKGTKSSVLTEAANYIRMLQQQQYRSEIDRHQLVQQMQMIGGGTLGPQAASAIRHVAAQNGVWSLGNFGGVPPRSAMTCYQQGRVPGSPAESNQQEQNADSPLNSKVEEHEYRFVFNSCSVGMAIASMGGAFIDCNQLFCQLSNYSKQEVCSMTIFNLTSRQDLQPAFDLISQMISPPAEGRQGNARPCLLRGAMKNRNDLGLSISLTKGEDGMAKCFCVTLIKNPASPFDQSQPILATADFIENTPAPMAQPRKEDGSSGINSSPAYTAG